MTIPELIRELRMLQEKSDRPLPVYGWDLWGDEPAPITSVSLHEKGHVLVEPAEDRFVK